MGRVGPPSDPEHQPDCLPMKTRLFISVFAAALLAVAACASPEPDSTPSIADARAGWFAAAEGTDEDCADWLQWCIDEGYPQEACEERNEYCVDGEWVGGDGDDDDRPDDDDTVDPCDEVATLAYEECIDAGGTAEDCREAAGQAYDDCVRGE